MTKAGQAQSIIRHRLREPRLSLGSASTPKGSSGKPLPSTPQGLSFLLTVLLRAERGCLSLPGLHTGTDSCPQLSGLPPPQPSGAPSWGERDPGPCYSRRGSFSSRRWVLGSCWLPGAGPPVRRKLCRRETKLPQPSSSSISQETGWCNVVKSSARSSGRLWAM